MPLATAAVVRLVGRRRSLRRRDRRRAHEPLNVVRAAERNAVCAARQSSKNDNNKNNNKIANKFKNKKEKCKIPRQAYWSGSSGRRHEAQVAQRTWSGVCACSTPAPCITTSPQTAHTIESGSGSDSLILIALWLSRLNETRATKQIIFRIPQR